MNYPTVLIAFLLFFCRLSGQETKGSFELGPTVLTINSLKQSKYEPSRRAPVEFINGLFFRYTRNKVGLRSFLIYNENYFYYEPEPNSADGETGSDFKKDLRIGGGLQYSVLNKGDWLYTMIDVAYRNVYTSGFVIGGIVGKHDSFSSTTNGIDAFAGVGFKLKMESRIYVSPEIGYRIFYGEVVRKGTDVRQGTTYKDNYIETYRNFMLKVQFTIKF